MKVCRLIIFSFFIGCASTSVTYNPNTDYVIIEQSTFFRQAETIVEDGKVKVEHKRISFTLANALSGLIGALSTKLGFLFP